jgi:hypothetical protein
MVKNYQGFRDYLCPDHQGLITEIVLGMAIFNTFQAGCVIWRFLLVNMADRSHDMTILGHIMLQHIIPCSGAMQTHNLCVVCLPNVLLSSQKCDLSVFLSHSKGKCLWLQVMPLSVFMLYVPGNNFVMQYYGSRMKAVEDQAIACETCSESDSDRAVTGDNKEL